MGVDLIIYALLVLHARGRNIRLELFPCTNHLAQVDGFTLGKYPAKEFTNNFTFYPGSLTPLNAVKKFIFNNFNNVSDLNVHGNFASLVVLH